MVVLKQDIVDGIDWGVIGVAGCLMLISLSGAVLALRYYPAASSSRRPATREFNLLWRARVFTELLAAVYAVSHLLRLQKLWGPASVFKSGGFHPTTFCRVYIAATYGVFEPAFLLLALFACLYSVQGRDSAKNPNFNIVLFSAGFSLPSCAAQLVAALFTRIFDLNYAGNPTLRRLFAPHDAPRPGGPPVDACDPASTPPGNCAFCVFPLLSTFVSAAFCGVYLLAMWVVTQRVAAAVINKALARRVRGLQLATTGWVVASLACRGCTVLFAPFQLGFEALRVAHMLSVTGLVLTLEWYLVIRPVWDAHTADRTLRRLERQGNSLPAPLLPNPLYPPPTELQLLESSSTSREPRQQGEEDRV